VQIGVFLATLRDFKRAYGAVKNVNAAYAPTVTFIPVPGTSTGTVYSKSKFKKFKF
jgi:hypothetical protein